MDSAEQLKDECMKRLDAFCDKYPQYQSLSLKARRVLKMLTGSGEPLRGKLGGWAGGIIHALTYTGCGVPGVLNSDLEEVFDATIGVIRKRAARIEQLFDIHP